MSFLFRAFRIAFGGAAQGIGHSSGLATSGRGLLQFPLLPGVCGPFSLRLNAPSTVGNFVPRLNAVTPSGSGKDKRSGERGHHAVVDSK